jgi:hypothetical protein
MKGETSPQELKVRKDIVIVHFWNGKKQPLKYKREQESKWRHGNAPKSDQCRIIASCFSHILHAPILSNGHSTANLSNLSTRRKFAIFGEFKYSPKWPFLEMCWTRQTCQHSPAWFARTRRLAKAKFCKYYVNLASLASLANLASVG